MRRQHRFTPKQKAGIMSHRKISFAFVVFLILLLLVGCTQPTKLPPNQAQRGSTEYNFAAEILYDFFIFPDSLPADTFGFATPQALYQSVNERWTVYFPPDSAQQFLNFLTTQSGGMGVLLDSVANGFVIKQVFPNSPALAAGLMKGDTIDSINGSSLAGVSFDVFLSIAGGNIGDQKTLHIIRASGPVTIVVTLGTYLAPSVFADSLDSTAAYIYLWIFSSQTDMPGGTTEEMDSALVATQWAPYTVLDLRGCPGGDIDQCVGVCGRFIADNTPIIRIHEWLLDTVRQTISLVDTELVSSFRGASLSRRFVLLVDSNTASAAEILTSCLMSDRPDITTMGTRTFGKARGQVLYMTPDTGLVKVTYALLKPVVGQPYDLVGIQPDISVPPDSDAITVAEALIAQNTGATKRLASAFAARTRSDSRINALRKEYGRAGAMPMAIKKMKTRL
jgi:C-terminal peptidase prc